jgi:Exonuclease
MSTSSSYGYLTYHDGPLVWIDCEMTGLDYKTDKILEIAVSAFSLATGDLPSTYYISWPTGNHY